MDTGVHKTILCGAEWRMLRQADPSLWPKLCKVKFTPYGTSDTLDMIGRTKGIIKNEAGRQMSTNVYIARGGHQSLLGLKDARALGIITINREGEGQDKAEVETMNRLHTLQKADKADMMEN